MHHCDAVARSTGHVSRRCVGIPLLFLGLLVRASRAGRLLRFGGTPTRDSLTFASVFAFLFKEYRPR
jgi:hypothetical protein